MAEELLAEEGLTENIITLINELKLNVQINVYYFKLIPRKECNLVFFSTWISWEEIFSNKNNHCIFKTTVCKTAVLSNNFTQ